MSDVLHEFLVKWHLFKKTPGNKHSVLEESLLQVVDTNSHKVDVMATARSYDTFNKLIVNAVNHLLH